MSSKSPWALRVADHVDASAVLGELDGIGGEIDHDLLQRPLIGVEEGSALVDGDRQRLAAFARLRGDEFQRALERALGFDHLRLNLHAACFDLGHVEEIVDQRQKMRPGIVDVACIFLVARAADRTEALPRDQLGKSQDRVQWRAQLVADIGEERCLGSVRGFRFGPLDQRVVPRFLQLTRQIFMGEPGLGFLVPTSADVARIQDDLDGVEHNDGREDQIDGIDVYETANKQHCGHRQKAGQEKTHVIGAIDEKARDGRQTDELDEDVIEEAIVAPQQPGRQSPC